MANSQTFLEKICCENCGHRLFDSYAGFSKCGITLQAGDVITPFGKKHFSRGQFAIIWGLLKAYPKVATLDSLVGFYEDVAAQDKIHKKEAENAHVVLRVYILKIRRELTELGIGVKTDWGYGYGLIIPTALQGIAFYDSSAS